MLKNYLFYGIAVAMLAGCSVATEDVAKEVEQAIQTDVAGEVEQNFVAPMTDEEALIVAEDVERAIYNLDILLYDDSGTVTEPDTEIMEHLISYATARFIEERVVLDEELCGTPCYTIEMPAFLNRAWQPVIHFTSEDEFSVTSWFATNNEDLHYSYEETVFYQFDGESWLMDTFSRVETDMNLTEANIAPYLAQLQYEVDQVGAAQTLDVMGQEETVYPFTEQGGDGATEHFVVARTGYVWINQDGEYYPEEVEVYDDDPIYQLLFYPWSNQWEDVDASSPVVADFLARLEAIDMRIYEAYEAENGLEVAEEMLADYNALHEEIYDAYSAGWDADYRENYEMENRSWYFHYTNSLQDYVPEEATDVEQVLLQAEAVKNRISSILVNEQLQ